MRIPKAIQQVVESFERLPGVGPKTAQRLTFYLLHVPQSELDRFANSVANLKTNTVMCSICFSVDETDPCSICSDEKRDHSLICVVEQPLDVLALEKSGRYKGIYHVLHGKIDPLNNIGPDEIRISELLQRASIWMVGKLFYQQIRLWKEKQQQCILPNNSNHKSQISKLRELEEGFQPGLIWNTLTQRLLNGRWKDEVSIRSFTFFVVLYCYAKLK